MRQHRVRRYRHKEGKPEEGGIPRGVRFVAWARTVRWIGWGFGESLIPIVIISFSSSFAVAGLFQSSYEIVLLLILPFIGAFLDRSRAWLLIIVALCLYPFVGLSYFFVGAFGLSIFIVAAKAVNAVSYGLEGTAVDTYYRRMAPVANLSSAFGYIDTLSNLGWMAAGLVGIFLIVYVPAYYLLLLIAPASLIALLIAVRAPKDAKPAARERVRLLYAYRTAMRDIVSWNAALRLLAVLAFFTAMVDTLIVFFIPIDAYIDGAGPALIILMGVISAIPCTFGYALGRYIDHRKPRRLVSAGLIGVAGISVLLAIFPQYAVKLLATFLFGILLEFFTVISKKLLTTMSYEEEYGQRGSTFEGIGVLGNLVGPLLLGVLIDAVGFAGTSMMLAVAALIIGIGFMFTQKRHWEPV